MPTIATPPHLPSGRTARPKPASVAKPTAAFLLIWLFCLGGAQAAFVAMGSWNAEWALKPFEPSGASDIPGVDPGTSIDLSGGSGTATFTNLQWEESIFMMQAEGFAGGTTPKFRVRQSIDLNGNIRENQDFIGRYLRLESKLTADLSDTLDVGNFTAENGNLVVQMTWSGSHRRDIIQPEKALGRFDYRIEQSGKVSVYGGGATPIGQGLGPSHIPTLIEGTFDNLTTGGTPTDTNGLVSGFLPHFTPGSYPRTSTFRLPISSGTTTVPIALNLVDDLALEFDVRDPDRAYELMELHAERDFYNTIEFRLGVEDADGNLLEDATITSANGYTYDAIPEPSAATLIIACTGLLASTRRRRS